MEVEHRLARCGAVVLHYIVAGASESLLHGSADLRRHRQNLCRGLRVNLVQVLEMMLRKNQGMALRCRSQVQDGPEIRILIYGRRGDLPVCDFAENTVFIDHVNHSPLSAE